MRRNSVLQMTRGEAALSVPSPIVELGKAVDRVIASDLSAARLFAERELEELRRAEHATGRRLHKGHPLHNIGVTLAPSEPLRARTFFHAAVVEDARTYPAERPERWGKAEQVLAELYGERGSAVDALKELARDTLTDPFELAEAFEHREGNDLGVYVGIRAGWRQEAELDGYEPEELVFVAGNHALLHHMKALRDAVVDAGPVPVVVKEFPDRADDNPYTKSRRLLGRCGSGVFDVTLPDGQIMEMTLAVEIFRIPVYSAHVTGSVTGALHGTSLLPGALATLGIQSESVTDSTQLREAARAWLKRTVVRPRPLEERRVLRAQIVSPPGSASPYPGATPGSAFPSTTEAAFAVPSGVGYKPMIEEEDAAEAARRAAERLREDNPGRPRSGQLGRSTEPGRKP